MADEALEDVWDIGPRAAPVKLSPIKWNENPADKYWRYIFYSLRPLTNLLSAYYTTGNVAYRDKLLEVVKSYVAFEKKRGDTAHEYLDDPHTAAFRAMMLVNIYGKLSRTGDLPDDVAAGMRDAISKVAVFLTHEENFQATQNHGFNESAALLLIAVNFPEMKDAPAWKALGLRRLGTMTKDVVDADGVEVENSPFYQFYVLSFLQQDSKWMSKFGVAKPEGFDERIAAMFEYATYSTQPDGYVPLLGASVSLNVHKNLPNVYGEAALDESDALEDVTPNFTFIREFGEAGVAPTALNKRFSVSGQSFLRSSFGSKDDFTGQTWLSFNVGNVRNNHNHNDALAITYFANGKTLLTDSGLYEYESASNKAYPEYFKSTRAHNTVVVDGQDQPEGSRVVGGAVLQGEGWLYQSGRHTLYTGVSHRRSVLLLKRDVGLVLDTLESDTPHDYAQTWHIEKDALVTVHGLDLVALSASGLPELALRQARTPGLTVSLVKGQEKPFIQGFQSDKYGKKSPNYAVEYRTQASRASFATILTSGPNALTPTTVSTAYDDVTDAVKTTVCSADVKVLVTVVHQGAGEGERVTVQPSLDCQ